MQAGPRSGRPTGLGWPESDPPDAAEPPGAAQAGPVPRGTPADRPSDQRRLDPPARTRIVAVANQKGGVGKTTTAVNVAAALALQGERVLLVDLDPQGNASTALGLDHADGTPGTYEALLGGIPLESVAVESAQISGLYGVPATADLAGAEIELVTVDRREMRLRDALGEALRRWAGAGVRFDHVFIDCPPSLGLLTVNALVAAEEALIPIQCEYYALEGLGQLARSVDRVRAGLNPALRIGAILLTMYDPRTRLAAGVADDVRSHFGDLVLATVVPRSVRISEAPSYGAPVLTYDPHSQGARAYLAVARELMRSRAGSGVTSEKN